MNDAAKILLGKSSRAEAEQMRSTLHRHGISLALVHNSETCSSGCSTQLEIWAHPDDLNSIRQLLFEKWQDSLQSLGYDPNLANSIYDSNKSDATCPACGTVFSTTHTACPECGLCLSLEEENAPAGGSCGPKGCR